MILDSSHGGILLFGQCIVTLTPYWHDYWNYFVYNFMIHSTVFMFISILSHTMEVHGPLKRGFISH